VSIRGPGRAKAVEGLGLEIAAAEEARERLQLKGATVNF
jgi:uncharacterized protein (DUF849 family)